MATTTTAADAAQGSVAAAPGMPQLDFSTWGNQIFWLMVTLVVIYYVLSQIALPRIASVLEDRQNTILKDLTTAENLKRRAEDAEKAYDAALAQARTEAGRIAAQARAAIQADLDAAIARADVEIGERTAEGEAAIAAIRRSATDSITEVARDTTEALVAALGGKADAATVAAAVAANMKG
jgi:F-type H+-transporting ATPase subunit b